MSEKFLFSFPETSLKKVDTILYFMYDNYDELVCCGENSVDPDQLASSEANWSAFTLFSIEFISGFILFLYVHVFCLSIFRAKLGLLCGTHKPFLDKISYDNLLVPGQVLAFVISTGLTGLTLAQNLL